MKKVKNKVIIVRILRTIRIVRMIAMIRNNTRTINSSRLKVQGRRPEVSGPEIPMPEE